MDMKCDGISKVVAGKIYDSFLEGISITDRTCLE
jgi:hypothetical protein